MAVDVIYDVAHHDVGGIHACIGKIECDVGQGIGAYLDIGHYAATVAHCPAVACLELVAERICHRLFAAAFVVDSLYAAPGGDVVVRGGELHLRVVGQRHGHLHKTLAVGLRADDDTAVEVLQRAAGDF